jgi:hypothetical protein
MKKYGFWLQLFSFAAKMVLKSTILAAKLKSCSQNYIKNSISGCNFRYSKPISYEFATFKINFPILSP